MSEAKEKSSLTAAFFLRLLGKATEESDFRQRKAPVLPYKPEWEKKVREEKQQNKNWASVKVSL